MSTLVPYRNPAVRDLAWVMASPGLLKPSPTHPGDRLVSDEWCQRLIARHHDWLQAIDEDPSDLTAWLAHRRNHRLGYYFEALVAYWLARCPAFKLHNTRIQIRDGERTVGELDFLFYDRDRAAWVHWEVAVKFYLLAHDRQGVAYWYGPDPRDRLDLKLARMFDHQLKVPTLPAARRVLPSEISDSLHSEAFIKGYLFYPLECHMNVAKPGIQNVSEHHLRGWWTRFPNARLPKFDNPVRWKIVPRLQWLAPQQTDEMETDEWVPDELVHDILAHHFKRHARPVLLAAVQQDHSGRWVEQCRGFVVGEHWPAQG
jgi:hypothetical protein